MSGIIFWVIRRFIAIMDGKRVINFQNLLLSDAETPHPTSDHRKIMNRVQVIDRSLRISQWKEATRRKKYGLEKVENN